MQVQRITVDDYCPSDDEISSEGIEIANNCDVKITENTTMNNVVKYRPSATEKAEYSTVDECGESLIENDATLGANVKAMGLECENENDDIDEGEKYVLSAPDGGWGWMVVLGCFSTYVSIIISFKCFYTVIVKVSWVMSHD